jgi:metacaspase-1
MIAMQWLVEDARPDDALFIHCECSAPLNTLRSHVGFVVDSGHGGRTRDQDGDEIDGWDEGKAIHIQIPISQLKQSGSYLPC